MVSETSFFPTERYAFRTHFQRHLVYAENMAVETHRCVPASLLDDGEILKKAYWLAHNVAMVMFAIPSSVEKLV
ncbi:hypothetical protein MAR_003435 [Mya arenaria]|uniref:Uncharacterized protein n=1 Tax=Mya arenaria TaxID=6604 RepID=A0ABY7G7F7_MYAAR|nr:hypothetical protein MAR_003435 [Mya arenaria]